MHEGGFRIEKDFNDAWYFVRPDGIAVPNSGYRASDCIDDDIGDASRPYDDAPAGALLSVMEDLAKEPPAPVYWHQQCSCKRVRLSS